MSNKLKLTTGIVAGLLTVSMNSAVAAPGLVSRYTDQDLTLSVNSPLWNSVQYHSINLTKQMIFIPNGGGSVPNISIKSLHNGREIAFKLMWKDNTEDFEKAVDKFRDSVALQFPVKAGSMPSPFMGDRSNPVNIWQWRSDWQAESSGKDVYGKNQPQTDGVHAYPVDKNFLKSYYPEKPMGVTSMLEYVASGWGTLTRQEQQDVQAHGYYSHNDGTWEVVFLRDLERKDLSDATFMPGKSTYINFAVWNGSKKERNGQKSLSMSWTDLRLEPVKSQARR